MYICESGGVKMGKYEPLAKFLRDQRTSEVSLTFAEIERIVGAKLPPKAQHHRAWWSNNPSNNVMTKVWLAAGFRSEQVDLEGRRLKFRRVGTSSAPPSSGSAKLEPASAPACRHPLFGAFEDLIRIMPGTDLTEPADPFWGKD
jgi:hypothetical protein